MSEPFPLDSKDSLSPTTKAILALMQALLPSVTAVIGALWIAFTYLDQHKETQRQQSNQAEKDNSTRFIEARKPFIDKQLALYIETAQVVGRLVSIYLPPKGQGEELQPTNNMGEWEKDFRRYEALYWTELSMVEDEGVKEAMQSFATKIRWIHENDIINLNRDDLIADFDDLKQRAYRLARALRSGLEVTWHVNLSGGNTQTP